MRAAVTHLRDRDLDAPDVMLLMSTGVGLFTERLSGVLEVPLAEVPEVPALWSEGVMVTGRLGELVVWALVENPPLFDDHHPIRPAHTGHAVRDQQHGAILHRLAQTQKQTVLGKAVERRGGLVENQERRRL